MKRAIIAIFIMLTATAAWAACTTTYMYDSSTGRQLTCTTCCFGTTCTVNCF